MRLFFWVPVLTFAAACGGKAIVDPPIGAGGSGSTGSSGNGTTNGSGTGSTSGGTTNGTGSGSTGSGSSSDCQEVCSVLFKCTQDPDLCPAADANETDFVSGCLEGCSDNAGLVAVVNPNNCDATIEAVANFSEEFAAFCFGDEDGDEGSDGMTPPSP